jgi:hypothetical protein
MAGTNDISFKVVATADGFDIVRSKQKGLADSIDKTNKSTKDLDKTQEKNYGRQKQGLIQTANGTKNFSKLSQSIGGGSSGLVGAYATLAANVFAASAAFNAFRQAAAFEQLVEGFTFMANESGRTTSIVVDRLKEITGEALSTQEALQGASLALSAGFSTTQLEGLAKVARGASLALGRNLNDAFDRLTRGAIKLEPEILDELGIMVRLDDATDAYANTLGKTSAQLTQFQRQTAFLTAINEQGAKKYGDIADAIDVNPYDKLAAAFTDLTKAGLTSINTVLIPIANLFSGSGSAMIGGLVLFGSTILTSMIPALGQMSQRAADAADHQHKVASALHESADESLIASRNQILAIEKPSASMKKFQGALKKGAVDEKKIKKELILAEKRLSRAVTASKDGVTEVTRKNAKARIEINKAEIRSLKELQNASKNASDVLPALNTSASQVDMADRTSTGLSAINQAGPIGGFKEANKQFKDFRKNANTSAASGGKLAAVFPMIGRNAKLASVGIKFFGSALLNMIPFIGQAIFAFGVLSTVFSKIKNMIDPPIKALESMGEIVDGLPDKFEQLRNAINKTGVTAGEASIKKYKVTAGVLQEMSNQANNAQVEMKKLTKEQIALADARTVRAMGKSALEVPRFEKAREKIAENFQDKTQSGLVESLKGVFEDQSEEGVLLRNALLEQASAMGITLDKDGGTTASVEQIVLLLKGASKTIDSVNGELVSLEKQVTSNEKVFGKFFSTFEKKTKFDDSLASFEAMDKTLAQLDATTDKGEIETILEGMGAQAKKFGLSAETAKDKLPGLIASFKQLKTNAINLQTSLKGLDAGIKVAKKFEKLSADGTRRTLELSEKRIKVEMAANQEQIKILEALEVKDEEREGILAQIAELETKNSILKTGIKEEAEKLLIIEQTRLALAMKDLAIEKQISDQVSSTTAINAKFQAALGGGQQSKLQLFQQTLKATKEQVRLEKELIDQQFEKIDLSLKLQQTEAHSTFLNSKRTVQDLMDYSATNTRLKEEIRLNNELRDSKKEGADAKTTSAITAGIISDDLMTTVAAYGELDEATDKNKAKGAVAITAFNQMGSAIGEMNSHFGESIALIGKMTEQVINMATTVSSLTEIFTGEDSAFEGFEKGAAKAVAAAQVVGTAIAAFGAAQQGLAQSRVREVDNSIAAEKRLDGKSKESVAKIKAMEAKKLSIQKKAFEDNKKIQIATAIISTAVAAAVTYGSLPFPFSAILAGAVIALGMAQVNMIKKTTFSGGGDNVSAGGASSINVGGSRSNKVDVSMGASGGEASFLRGGSGVGSNANDFTPGGAMGRKGYASGGMLVGERGPEVVTKEEIIPNYQLGGGKNMNVTFNVSALDGQSVQELLTNNQGAVVGAIRDAANSYGQDFLPEVNLGYDGGG